MKEEDMAGHTPWSQIKHRKSRGLVALQDDAALMGVYYDLGGPDSERVGEVLVEIVNGNVVVTLSRIDEAKFGPVSVVVV